MFATACGFNLCTSYISGVHQVRPQQYEVYIPTWGSKRGPSYSPAMDLWMCMHLYVGLKWTKLERKRAVLSGAVCLVNIGRKRFVEREINSVSLYDF